MFWKGNLYFFQVIATMLSFQGFVWGPVEMSRNCGCFASTESLEIERLEPDFLILCQEEILLETNPAFSASRQSPFYFFWEYQYQQDIFVFVFCFPCQKLHEISQVSQYKLPLHNFDIVSLIIKVNWISVSYHGQRNIAVNNFCRNKIYPLKQISLPCQLLGL